MLAIQQKRPKHNAMSSACPACGSRSGVYASRPVTTTTREIFFHCANPDCDATFRAVLQIVNFIIPSLMPEGDPRRLHPDESAPRLRSSRGRPPRSPKPPETPPPLPPHEAARRRITRD